MENKNEPRFKSYKEFTEEDKKLFIELYGKILEENNKRTDLYRKLQDFKMSGYDLAISDPWNSKMVIFKSMIKGEPYSIAFKVDVDRNITKLDPIKGEEEYELQLSTELKNKVFKFLDSIIIPPLSAFNRRAAALRGRISLRKGGKRRTYKLRYKKKTMRIKRK